MGDLKNDRQEPNTADLLRDVQRGNPNAMEELLAKLEQTLRVWARGRVPLQARGLLATNDVVQESLARIYKALEKMTDLQDLQVRAYARRVLKNLLTDLARQGQRRPEQVTLQSLDSPPSQSPLGAAMQNQLLERYRDSLAELPNRQRIALCLRLEFGCSDREMAAVLGMDSPDAARMLAVRGMKKLTQRMNTL